MRKIQKRILIMRETGTEDSDRESDSKIERFSDRDRTERDSDIDRTMRDRDNDSDRQRQ